MIDLPCGCPKHQRSRSRNPNESNKCSNSTRPKYEVKSESASKRMLEIDSTLE
jgi:hypothetical protein